MSEQKSSRIERAVLVPNAVACHTETSVTLRDGDPIRLFFDPARRYTYGDVGQFTSDIPTTATAYIGGTRVTMTPEVWRAFITGMSELLDEYAPVVAEAVAS